MDMHTNPVDEWDMIESLLPDGWVAAAKTCGAFQRARQFDDPGALLRMLLIHASGGCGVRATVANAGEIGVAKLSSVAFHKRMRNSADWLSWICSGLCDRLRSRCLVHGDERILAVDGMNVFGMDSKRTQWRIDYAYDLRTFRCEWFAASDVQNARGISIPGLSIGDVVVADGEYYSSKVVQDAKDAGAVVVIRMPGWVDGLEDRAGQMFSAVDASSTLRVGEIGDWFVRIVGSDGGRIDGRVISTRLPAAVAVCESRGERDGAFSKSVELDRRDVEACQFAKVFTTIAEDRLDGRGVFDLCCFRWQVERVFAGLRALIGADQLRHTEPDVARTWVTAKLVLAFLDEVLVRESREFSPFGLRIGAGLRV
ncbi:MAG: hypothetical protein FWD57_13900 [Polyangiaceae bacterium]|nr:hypothetical protein [Polyangiaceae bacterium]